MTRRAVLGAAFVVPVLGPPTDGAAAARAWGRKLAALDRAEAAMDAFCDGCRGGTLVFADQDAQEDAFGDRLDAFYAALRRLLRTPAPDFEALSVKIVLAVDHEVGTLTGGERCLAALKADARRLALKLRQVAPLDESY